MITADYQGPNDILKRGVGGLLQSFRACTLVGRTV